MGIDARGDHSFKIPRPEYSINYGTPNACSTCHDDKSPQWALRAIEAWHPQRKKPGSSEELFIASNIAPTPQGILKLANDHTQPAIVRASALSKLQLMGEIPGRLLMPFVKSSEPLIRLAVAQLGDVLSANEKVKILSPLLADNTRAVRVAAAYSLLGVQLDLASQAAFENAFQEMLIAQEVNSWRGDGLLQQGNAALRINDIEKAVLAYEMSIAVDPYFAPAYVNLADLYRRFGNTVAESETLAIGVEQNPADRALRYSYALHFVRHKQLDKTLQHVTKAMQLSPENSQYAYLYLLALESLGRKRQALSEIDELIERVSDNRQLSALKAKWSNQK